jgi:peptidyl-prolyl cis-trans isomerase B (cyclophilin B)
MQVRKSVLGILMAAAVGMAGLAEAAVIVPMKAYVKPDEAVLVKFENEKGVEGKKALDTLGWSATKIDEWFTPADDALDAHGVPTFKLYTFDGTKLDPTPGKAEADGSLNLGAFFPQMSDGGVYILTWKDATPVVIETLYNPGRGKAQLAKAEAEIDKLTPDEKKAALLQFGPTVTHLVPLEYAVIETDKGVIKAKFSYDIAPHTIDNFISLAKQGFYDGTRFHRIISGFMIQGGDSTGNIDGRAGTGGPGYEIMQEFSDVKKHERGTLSMARSDDPNSAGSQFFIMHQKSPNLDGQYTAFGDVTDGLPVVDEIAKTPVKDGNGEVTGVKPKITAIKILPATLEIYGIKP